MPLGNQLRYRELNTFEFKWDNIKVIYSTTGTDGKPYLTYEEAGSSKNIDIFQQEETEIGLLVTFMRNRSAPTCTVIIPIFGKYDLNHAKVPFKTICIFTSENPVPPYSAKRTYEVVSVEGMAQRFNY